MGFAEGDREAKKVFGLKSGDIDRGTKEAVRIFGVRRKSRREARRIGIARHRCGPNCSHLSVAARRFIARKIRKLYKEGYRGPQLVRIAFEYARRRGYHVPRAR